MDAAILRISERISTGVEIGESHIREFKSALDRTGGAISNRDPKAICRDIAETLVAFANADGGELFVGVEDDGTVSGVPHKEDVISMLVGAPKTHVLATTPLPNPTVSRVMVSGKLVLFFHVAKSTQRVHQTSEGRCLQRFDRENRPVPFEEVLYNRQEQRSREYDRGFVDGVTIKDLDLSVVDKVSKHVAGGQSPEKFLQYMDLAEYGEGLLIRRAALLLFATDVTRWHPRCEVRIVRVSGTELGVGRNYNVNAGDDQTVRGNILHILETAWDALRPYLTRTKLVESGLFRENLVYPLDACREALLNAVAHRDYSIEGKGIEILVFDDRLEVKSPGGLLASISLKDLQTGKRTHQSRNAYIARVLRELGYMREMGEGMLRIFSTMQEHDLVPPEIAATTSEFDMVLHHRSVFSPKDQDWLRAYAPYNLSRDEQRTILLGRDGHGLSTNEIMKALAIVDVDEFRKLVEDLRRKGILYTPLERTKRAKALRSAGSWRDVGRFLVRPHDQAEQYLSELTKVLMEFKDKPFLRGPDLAYIRKNLSSSSPYTERVDHSLKLLGFIDERMRPLPLMRSLKAAAGRPVASEKTRPQERGTDPTVKRSMSVENDEFLTMSAVDDSKARRLGKIIALKSREKYGFIGAKDGIDYFFHITDLVDVREWPLLREGSDVHFDEGNRIVPGKSPAAAKVKLIGRPR